MSRDTATGLTAARNIVTLLDKAETYDLEFHFARDPRGAPLCRRADDAQPDGAVIPHGAVMPALGADCAAQRALRPSGRGEAEIRSTPSLLPPKTSNLVIRQVGHARSLLVAKPREVALVLRRVVGIIRRAMALKRALCGCTTSEMLSKTSW
jgi:hypothetical protein